MTNFTQPMPENSTPNPPTDQQQNFTPEPLPDPPTLPFTLKASLAEYRKRLGIVRFIVAFILFVVIFLRFGHIVGIISAVLISLTIFMTLLALGRRTVTLNESDIEYKNAFGVVKKIAYQDISTVKVFLAYVEPSFGHAPRVIIGSKLGKPFFSFSTIFWSPTDIDLLLATAEQKKVTIETYADPAVSTAVAKQFPDYVGIYEKHPYWIAFGIVLLILVAVAAFVFTLM